MSAPDPLETADVTTPDNLTPAAPGVDEVSQILHARRVNLERCLVELEQRSSVLASLAGRMVTTVRAGGKLLVAGNGGSAADAQHFAGELVGRFQRERSPYAALALTADTSILTAITNDYGYEEVFARQVRALGNAGDMLILISTSGYSENLIRAAQAARDRHLYTVALTGDSLNPLAEVAEFPFRIPIHGTAAVQEVQGMLLHLLCDVVEAELASDEGADCDVG